MNDQELVVAALSGNQDAYTELYKMLYPRAKRIAFMFLRGYLEQDEAAHDILAKVLMNLHTFQSSAKLSTWATSIGRNHALEIRRRLKSTTRVPRSKLDFLDTPTVDGKTPIDVPDTGRGHYQWEAYRDTKEVLCRLDPGYRSVLIERFIHGRTSSEIAELWGTTVGNVKSQQHRAIRKAKRIFTNLHSFAVKEELT